MQANGFEKQWIISIRVGSPPHALGYFMENLGSTRSNSRQGVGNGLGYSLILIVVGAIRELLGSGQLLGIDILTTTQNGGWYVGNNFFLLAPSSFLIIGLFIWALRSWKTEQVEEKEFLMSKNAPKEVETHHA